MNRRYRLFLVALVLALASPALAFEGRGPLKAESFTGPTNSFPQAFWFGGDIPQTVYIPGRGNVPLAAAFQQALATQIIPALQASLTMYDGTGTDSGVTIHKPGTWDGYTLLSALSGHVVNGTRMYSILIDMNGTIVKEWPVFGFPAKMLPGGYIMGGASDPANGIDTLPNHQEQALLVEHDWCGTEVWRWAGIEGRPGFARWHHDYQREGNPVGYYAPGLEPKPLSGKTLILTHDNPPVEETGMGPDGMGISQVMLEDDSIYEVDWDGKVVWEWHAYQVFEQMGFTKVARDAIATNIVGAPADIGGGFPGTDWQHLNEAAYLGPNKRHQGGDLRFDPKNIIWDGRSSNIIAIIAHDDDPKGEWKAGDIVWKIGPNYGPGNPEYKIGQIIGQHHAHMIPRGLPGEGNILVFDNGGLAGFGALMEGLAPFWPVTYRDYSRVIEIDPVTLDVVWEYRLDKPDLDKGERKFFSWFISSAQRLPNGNTLIDEGSDGRIFEVTPSGEIVWEYIFKPGGPGVGGFGNSVYRAYRVPESWLPKDRTCPVPVAAK